MTEISQLDPVVFFARDRSERVTLQDTKIYEDRLKQKLTELALNPAYSEHITRLLASYQIPELPKEFDITDMCMSLKERDMLPALVFHLNPFNLIELFKELLGE